jgi:hypothetical protein
VSAGGDHNGVTEHLVNAYGACFFTDGVYAGGQSLGDFGVGFSLLRWSGYGAGRWCELTLKD